ncbi:MAG: arginine--tRNA ligase, partial [Chloroflexia bacterium]
MPREYALDRFERQIREALLATGLVQPEEISLLPPPPEVGGDLGLPCFLLARRLRRAPAVIAQDLAGRVSFPKESLVGHVFAQGPYVNFAQEPRAMARSVLAEVREWGDRYGGDEIGGGRNVIVDYSSPNVARRMHIGHVRSTVIGQA